MGTFSEIPTKGNTTQNGGTDATGQPGDTTHVAPKPDAPLTSATIADHAPATTQTNDATSTEGEAGGAPVNKLQQEGLLCWTKDLFQEGRSCWSNIFGGSSDATAPKYTTVDSVDSKQLSFDSIFNLSQGQAPTEATATTVAATTPDTTTGAPATTTDAATPPAASALPSGLASWVANMEKSLGASNVASSAKDGFDWLFSTKSNGADTTVSASKGDATVNGTNADGVKVDVTDNKSSIQGQVGDAQIDRTKGPNPETTYKSGTFAVDVNGDVATVVDASTGQTFSYNRQTSEGSIDDKSGKPIITFTSSGDLTQKLTADTSITQTNGSADATADQMLKQQAGKTSDQTQYVVDHQGNTAVLRPDGMVIKTYKATGEVLLAKDGHQIKITVGPDGHRIAQALEEGPDHTMQWVSMHGVKLPKGMDVKSDGTVTYNGQTVVDSHSNVKADKNTTIDTTSGTLTTASTTGTVVSKSDGQTTTVSHKGVGDIVSNGHTYCNTDSKSQSGFKSWDPADHKLVVMGGAGRSEVTMDTQPGGALNVIEPDGQSTKIYSNGTIDARDAQGNSLMQVDSAGNATFYDGTTIGADGTVSNDDGSASAWDDGSQASGAISEASAALAQAGAAANSANPDQSSLGALDAAAANLSSWAQAYTSLNMLNVVTSLNSMESSVASAESSITAKISSSQANDQRTGDSSPTVVADAVAIGSPTDLTVKQLREKGVSVPGDESNPSAA